MKRCLTKFGKRSVMVWLDKITYTQVLDDLTEREEELFEKYFDFNRIDGMNNTYHIDQSDLAHVRKKIKPKEAKDFERVLKALEKCFADQIDKQPNFDLILQI